MAAPRKTAEVEPEATPTAEAEVTAAPVGDEPNATSAPETVAPVKAAAKKPEAYKVLGALVEAKVGSRILHFYKGDILPEGVDKAALEHLKSLGFVAKA